MWSPRAAASDQDIDKYVRTDTFATVTMYTRISSELRRDSIATVVNNLQQVPTLFRTINRKNLSDIFSLYDVSVSNSIIPSGSGKLPQSLIMIKGSQLVKDFMVKDEDIRLRNVFDFIRSLKYVISNLGVLDPIKSTYNSVINKHIINSEVLSTRSLVNMSQNMNEFNESKKAISTQDRSWAKEKSPSNVPSPYNKWVSEAPAFFEVFSLPITNDEAQLYDIMQNLVVNSFMDYDSLVKIIDLFDTELNRVDRVALFNALGVNLSYRYPKFLYIDVPPGIFCVTPAIKLETSRMFESQLDIQILLSDPNLCLQNAKIALTASTFTARPQNKIVTSLSIDSISSLYIQLLSAAINPNVTCVDIQLDVQFITDTDLFNILILQKMVSCHLIRTSSRVMLNNVVAYILVNQCLGTPIIHPDFKDFTSLGDWFNPTYDRMLDVYRHLNSFVPSARTFIQAYIGNAPGMVYHDGRVSSYCERVWGGRAPLDAPFVYRGEAQFTKLLRRKTRGVIIPYRETDFPHYPYEQELTELLMAAANALTTSNAKHITRVRTPADTVNKYLEWLLQSLPAIRSFMNSYRTNLNRMLLTTGNDYVVKFPETQPSVRSIMLTQVTSMMCYVDKDSVFYGMVPVIADKRPDLSIGIAIFAKLFEKFDSELGYFKTEFTTTQRITAVMNEMSNFKDLMSPTLQKWFSDSLTVKLLLKAIKESSLQGIDEMIEAADAVKILMNSARLLRLRGYVECFYITCNPLRYRTAINGIYAMAVNACLPTPDSVKMVWTSHYVLSEYHSKSRTLERGDFIETSTLDKDLALLDLPSSPWVAFSNGVNFNDSLIKVEYPAIITTVIENISSPKPINSVKYDIDQIYDAMYNHRPIQITMTIQVPQFSPMILDQRIIDRTYANISGECLIGTVNDADFETMSVNEYESAFNMSVATRRENYVSIDKPELTFLNIER